MRLTEFENELFMEWAKTNEHFVKDGIVNEDEWNKSKIKILYILKEVNDPNGGGWDLREFVSKGGRSQTWDNIARWTYGIMNMNKEIHWDDMKNISEDFRKKWLQSICAVNIKKTPGGHTTNNDVLISQTEQDREFLIKQFALYNQVDIIICCGTIVSDLFHRNVNEYSEYKREETSRGIKYHKIGEHKYLIEFLHPEVRIGTYRNILFYGLIDAIKEIYKCILPNIS